MFQETLRMNERGLPVDIPLAKKTLKFLKEYNAERFKECTDMTCGIKPTQVGLLLQWLQCWVEDLKNLKRLTLEQVLKERELDEDVKEVIKIRLEQGRVSTKKLKKMIEMDSGDMVVRGSFIYHGAGTGRFTARRLQPHNFQRPTIKNVDLVIKLLETDPWKIVKLFKDPLEAIGSTMRGFFKAPPGFAIIVADYNAIEARVLVWLACETEAVLLFHHGKDIYCDMAAYIFGVDADIILAGHEAGDLKYSAMRKLGKDTVLGCGYNMGVVTFLCQMESKGSDDIAGIPLRLDKADRGKREKTSFNPEAWHMGCDAVYGYRKRYARIPKLWDAVELAARQAIKHPGTRFRVRVTKDAPSLVFYMDGHSLVMVLPSRREIYYPYCETITRPKRWGKKGETEEAIRFKVVNSKNMWVWEYIYGGKFVENAVQAISRDLMVGGMWHAAQTKLFAAIGTVHDEIIGLCKRRYGRARERIVKLYEETICKLPDWAVGTDLGHTIPLKAEGKMTKRYGK